MKRLLLTLVLTLLPLAVASDTEACMGPECWDPMLVSAWGPTYQMACSQADVLAGYYCGAKGCLGTPHYNICILNFCDFEGCNVYAYYDRCGWY